MFYRHWLLYIQLIFLLIVVNKLHAECYDSSEERAALFDDIVPIPLHVENSSLVSQRRNCFIFRHAFNSQKQQQSDFCFPTVLVAGFPKCATSFMFHTLSSHPSIIPTRRKELCLGGPLSENWSRFISYLPSFNEVSKPKEKIVLSGCLHLGANIRAMDDLCIIGKVKVIFLVRDVADMLWAAYNYWCNVDTDGPSCTPGTYSEISFYKV